MSVSAPAVDDGSAPLNGDFTYVDEFDGRTLSLAWVGIRTPRQPVYKLERGALVVQPQARLGDVQGVPAFVARRQQHHIANVSTVVEYTPGKEGDRAGLAAMQSDDARLFFGVTMVEGRPAVALITRENAKTEKVVASEPFAGGAITLTLRANGGAMAFEYRVGNVAKVLKTDLDVTFLSTRKAGGFVGTVIGPYASY